VGSNVICFRGSPVSRRYFESIANVAGFNRRALREAERLPDMAQWRPRPVLQFYKPAKIGSSSSSNFASTQLEAFPPLSNDKVGTKPSA